MLWAHFDQEPNEANASTLGVIAAICVDPEVNYNLQLIEDEQSGMEFHASP